MAEKPVLFEKDVKRRVATITLNRPDKLNALKMVDCDQIGQIMREVNEDDDVKVVVFKGNGKSFCSGHDMIETFDMYTGKPGERRKPQRARLMVDGEHLFGWRGCWTATATCWKATIAQVHGYCFGQGLYIAMACDIVITADNGLFTHPGWRYMGPVSAWQLIAKAGLTKAKEMMFTGRPIDAREAKECQLVTKVVPIDKLEDEVRKYADSIAKLPLDAIVMGKGQFLSAQDAMGMSQGYNTFPMIHEWQTNQVLEPGDFSIMKEMRDKGTTGAFRAREKFFGEQEEGRIR